jgi:predicted RNase H-like HicB family nuclease
MASYIALLRKETKSDYSVDFPDFPGCITAGKTLEEARQRAAEALAFHIEGLEEDGEPIPAPSDLDTVRLVKDHRDAVPFLVEVEPGSTVQRLNITMPTHVLRNVDAYAKDIGMTRSAFLVLAATREIAIGHAPRVAQSGRAKAGGKSARRKLSHRQES